MRFYLQILLIFCMATTDACSKSKKKHEASAPTNPTLPINNLTQAQKESFEHWKKNLIKSCDASEVFGVGENTGREPGIDAPLLIQKNGGSVVFSDAGNLAILTDYISFSGESTTKAEEDVLGHSIKAETKRIGSTCSVYLFGEKVHEATLVQSFVVGLNWSQDAEKKPLLGQPTVKALGRTGAGEVVGLHVFNLIAQEVKPTRAALTIISQKLEITTEQAKKVFVLSPANLTKVVTKIEQESSAVWTSGQSDHLIADLGKLTALFDGTARSVPLEIRLGIPGFLFGEVKNSADDGNMKLHLNVSVVKKDSTNFELASAGGIIQGFQLHDKSESLKCLDDRALAYLGGNYGANLINPSVQVLIEPCQNLFSGVETASFENGWMKGIVSSMFSTVVPSTRFQYGGWDTVLSKLAIAAFKDGLNISQELDPDSHARVILNISEYFDTMRAATMQTRNLAASKDSILKMGLAWSYRGLSVPNAKITEMVQAFDHSIIPFKISTEILMDALGQQPAGLDEQITFAQDITELYKSEALRALSLSKDLDFADFENRIFNQIIQKRISVDELTSWAKKFEGIKSQMAPYSNLTPVKGLLVGASIKWLDSNLVSVDGLASIYAAISNVVDPFEESTKTLAQGLQASLQANQPSLDYARAITIEFKSLAVTVRDLAKAIDYESWGETFFSTILQSRPTLDKLRAWKDTLTSAQGFVVREKDRVKGDFNTGERNRESILRTALDETWTNSDFTGLEALADLARLKMPCERNEAASDLANCVGLPLFSRATKRFFDPAFDGRYVPLGKQFTDHINSLTGNNWTTLRWQLLDEFFGSFNEPIWSKCDNTAFAARSTTLKSLIASVVAETDALRRFELERGIRDTLDNCR